MTESSNFQAVKLQVVFINIALMHTRTQNWCQKWDWSAECDQAFSQLKEMLAQKTRLFHYDPTRQITLAADASFYGIGAVIFQCSPDGTEEPIAFASKTLTSTEKNYSQVEKKALPIILGVR